ncbi:MAG: hypothetical protein K6A61_07165 [Butyrivibrio sp.]|nr:hypothetical protein [Butyrivibrio sp.]
MINNNKFVKRILRKYLFPSILTILSTTFIGFINSIIAGRMLGKQALGIINIVSSFTFLFSMLGCLISIGASTCASIAIGKDERDETEEYTAYALIISIVLPIIIAVPFVVFYKNFMMFMGAGNEIYMLSARYARIMISFGFLTTLMYFPFNFLRLDGRGISALYVFGIMGITDVILVLTFLHFGMGLTGIGVSVVISTAVADVAGLILLFSPKERQVRVRKIPLSEILSITKSVLKRGGAAGLNNLCNMLRTLILSTWMLKYLGTDGASVFAVAGAVINFTAAGVVGSGQTISPLVGIFYGEKDSTSIRMLMKSAVNYAVFLHILLCIIAVPCSGYIAGIFGISEEPLNGITATAISFVLLSLIPASIVNVYIYYYAALKKTLLSCFLTFCRAFGFVAFFSYLLLIGGYGEFVFVAFPLAELLTILVIICYASIVHKKHPEINGLLMMSDTENENYISFSVENTVEGAVYASTQMMEFFKDKDVPSKYKVILPMSLEELLIIVNEYCLKDMLGQYIDVRIFIDNEDIMMRIRCGGKVFDPVAWYRKKRATITAEEMLMDDSLGMMMIDKQSKDITFQNTFGVNNLVVII